MSLRTATFDCPACGYPTGHRAGDACLLCGPAATTEVRRARETIALAFDRLRGGACEEEARELWGQIDRAEAILAATSSRS